MFSHNHSHSHSHNGGCCEDHQPPKPYSYSSLFKDEEKNLNSNSHGHDHSHSHSHSDSCSHDHSHDHNHNESNNDEIDNEVEKFNLFSLLKLNNFEAIKIFLANNPNEINVPDELGNYPIHWACKLSQVYIIDLFLNYGADLNLPTENESKMLPIHWAVAEDRCDVLSFLLTGVSIKYNIRRATPPFTNINALNGKNCTPASIAVQYGQINSFIYLLEKGADPTLPDINGDECLHWAAYKANLEMATLVLYYSSGRVNCIDKYGQTPLHLAAIKGNTSVVELLIKKFNADINIRDKSNNTPLDLAISKKHLRTEYEIRRLLVKTSTTGGGGSELPSKIGMCNSLTQGFLCYNYGGIINGFKFIYSLYRENRLFLFLKYLFLGSNEYESSVWMWRITFLSNFYATYLSIMFNFNENLRLNHPLILRISIILIFLWWFFFLGCLLKDPGVVSDDQYDELASKKKRALLSLYDLEQGINVKDHPEKMKEYEKLVASPYKQCLESITNHYDNPVAYPEIYQACHTCGVRKPIRSKHCKIVNKCIYKFDHFW